MPASCSENRIVPTTGKIPFDMYLHWQLSPNWHSLQGSLVVGVVVVVVVVGVLVAGGRVGGTGGPAAGRAAAGKTIGGVMPLSHSGSAVKHKQYFSEPFSIFDLTV